MKISRARLWPWLLLALISGCATEVAGPPPELKSLSTRPDAAVLTMKGPMPDREWMVLLTPLACVMHQGRPKQFSYNTLLFAKGQPFEREVRLTPDMPVHLRYGARYGNKVCNATIMTVFDANKTYSVHTDIKFKGTLLGLLSEIETCSLQIKDVATGLPLPAVWSDLPVNWGPCVMPSK